MFFRITVLTRVEIGSLNGASKVLLNDGMSMACALEDIQKLLTEAGVKLGVRMVIQGEGTIKFYFLNVAKYF